ncbi:MAG TPA: DUF222 domain-containing protein [Acidimicrobiia bacterium]|nr:DUF222 domain-containing protein [Acidimicrobiia bacterium]
MYSVIDDLDGLRCRETSWLEARHDELVREVRRLQMEDIAVIRVLDERGRVDDTLAAREGISLRAVREKVATARALESLPNVAAAAHAGDFSEEQLASVARLANEATDAEWAARAPNISPVDLSRMVRTAKKPTIEESRARREARHLKWWWNKTTGMFCLRGELADVDGARVEEALEKAIERKKPAKGDTWDSRDHRGADVFVEAIELHDKVHGSGVGSAEDPSAVHARAEACGHTPTADRRPLLVVQVPLQGPATVAGIPLCDAKLEQLRASALIEPVLVDDHGATIRVGRRSPALSPKITRAVPLRDGHCRWPGCDRRVGLQVHHLVPRSWGGTDDISNLASVCWGHHPQLVPHGNLALVGNPNQPDGLRLVSYDQLDDDDARHWGLPPPRPPRQ